MEGIWLSVQPHLKATYGLSVPICQMGRNESKGLGKMGYHKGSQGQMWPPVSTVGPHGQLCPTPTCSQGPQAFTSALWQETSPRADSLTGTEIVPAEPQQFPGFSIYSSTSNLELLGPPLSSTWWSSSRDWVRQDSPRNPDGGRGYSTSGGKGRKEGAPRRSAAVLTPPPANHQQASGPQFSLPFL